MQTTFYILLNIKTPAGLENYGRFWVGNDHHFAYELFNQLNGSNETSEENILYMELMETRANLPVNLKIISCTLDQMAQNCRLVIKETFKRFSLKA